MPTRHTISPTNLPPHSKLYAIRGPNISSECGMYDLLQNMDSSTVPIFPLLLLGSSAVQTHAFKHAHLVDSLRQSSIPHLPRLLKSQINTSAAPSRAHNPPPNLSNPPNRGGEADLNKFNKFVNCTAESICNEFNLNLDQRAMLLHCANWLTGDKSKKPALQAGNREAGGDLSNFAQSILLVHGQYFI